MNSSEFMNIIVPRVPRIHIPTIPVPAQMVTNTKPTQRPMEGLPSA